MNILFVCKYNRFRSKVAEAFFNEFNKNKKNQAKSAGMRIDAMRPYVAQSVIDALDERGVVVASTESRAIDELLIEWADKIVVVADNTPLERFPRQKLLIWPISDADEHDMNRIKKIIVQIENQVKNLLDDLG